MYLLKKLFQARSKVAESRSKWDDVEKPFMDHLEDLRKMLTKVVFTLLISMSLCFVFDKELLEIVRYPVKLAGLDSLDGSKLPEKIAEADWGRVKDMSRALGSLPGEERGRFLNRVPLEIREAVLATLYFRASLALPQDQRKGFIEESVVDPAVRATALFLAENNPNAHIDDTGQLLRMTALGPAETFTLTLKLSFFAGIVLAFPLLLWFIAEFIIPGLTAKERKMVLPSVLVGFLLFLVGVCFAYFVVAPRALRFFYEYSMRLGVISDWRIGYFVSFVTQFTLIFGLCFELPVVVMALVKLGMLSYTSMSQTRSYAIVAIVVVAAIITPTTDAFTLALLAGPMLVLYELCIWLAWMIEKSDRKRQAKDEKDWQERMLVPAVDALAETRDPEARVLDVDGVPVVEPAAGSQPMEDPDDGDELPPGWGDTDDPYNSAAWEHTQPAPDDQEPGDEPTPDEPSGEETPVDEPGDADPENDPENAPVVDEPPPEDPKTAKP